MTRDDVLDVLDKVVSLKRRGVQRAEIPVQFLEDRMAVLLPADKFAPDEQVRLAGKFQNMMTVRKHAHAYLDFTPVWKGLDTPMARGF